jgi:threonylcarbamoyladenosine tRNA methylthiotransferase MtaB
LKNFRNFKTKHKRNCSYGVNIGDYGKGEFGNKKTRAYLLELVQELDKVEGIERLRISSIEPNLLKNETIEFVSKVELCATFHSVAIWKQ